MSQRCTPSPLIVANVPRSGERPRHWRLTRCSAAVPNEIPATRSPEAFTTKGLSE